MLELTPAQIAVLKRLAVHGFQGASFPLYANAVGVRKGNCAALLGPVAGGMRLVAEPSYLVDGNLSVRVTRGARNYFVWKKQQIEVTPERQAELERFETVLNELLMLTVNLE